MRQELVREILEAEGTTLTRFTKLLPAELILPFIDANRDLLLDTIGVASTYFYRSSGS